MKPLARGTIALFAIAIAGCNFSDYEEELGGGYYFSNEGPTDKIIVPHGWRNGDPYVPCDVESYVTDDRFILARQRVTKRCFWEKENPMSDLAGETRFWIIDKQKREINGPWGDEDFERRLLELGVSKSLSAALE